MSYNKPLPVIDNWNRGFWAAAQQEKLAAPHCQDCGKIFFPPGPCCPHCMSQNLTWKALSGRGTVETWTVFHQLYFKGFATDLPYNVAVVQLEEGISLMTNIVGIPNDRIASGMQVEVVFEKATDDITLPKFRPNGPARPQ
jgi:uncharacterized OB-fold protein